MAETYIPTGQWSPVTAYRKNIKGHHHRPAPLHVERLEDLKRSAERRAREAARFLAGSPDQLQ
jgi:hypothetical protein